MGDMFLSTSGTHEPSLVRIHAREIWAMLAPRFLAISSTLVGFEEVIAYIIKRGAYRLTVSWLQGSLRYVS